MKTRTADALTVLLQPVIEAMGYEFVGLEHFPQGRRSTVRIYIDTAQGVTVDDCARVSHQVSGILDVEDPINGGYVLEVSSPGDDRLLFTPDQFRRFAGRNVTVKLDGIHNGRRKVMGTLVGLDGDDLLVVENGLESRVPMVTIEKVRLVPETGK